MLSKADIDKARADRLPVIALRPDGHYTDELDDIVVKHVETFRAEAMSDDCWWMACYFANGETLSFHVVTAGPANRKQRIAFTAGEEPAQWIDFDTGERHG